MTLKVAVVDDEIPMVDYIHKKIEQVLRKLKVQCEIHDFTNGKTALEKTLDSNFDIIFLDIDMPDISGMDIAKKLRLQEENVVIIFITNKDEFVYDAIKYAPFRFIRKSCFENEIQEAIYKYIERINNNRSTHVFSTPNGKRTVRLTKVRYVEVSSHKLFVHEVNGEFVANGNLKDIEEFFCKLGFIRIHQSYIVNYRFINLIKRNEVILDDGLPLPLSRSKYENAKFEYMRLSREEW